MIVVDLRQEFQWADNALIWAEKLQTGFPEDSGQSVRVYKFNFYYVVEIFHEEDESELD